MTYAYLRILIPTLVLLMSAFVYFLFHESKTDKVQNTIEIERVIPRDRMVQAPGVPARLLIPSIDVAAEIQQIGLAPGNPTAMDVPSNFIDVGWYKDGPRPGAIGSAVIDGHLNGKNIPKAVFYRLDSLMPGDRVYIVDTDMKALEFRVIDVRTYEHDALTEDVFTNTKGASHLNLITCAGTWMKEAQLYDKRTVVFTELVNESLLADT